MLAKGVDAVAARIRERAAEHRVPMVEDVPLARALHAACEVGDEIPGELFEAVAHVLAFVMSLRARGSAAGVHTDTRRRGGTPDGDQLRKDRRDVADAAAQPAADPPDAAPALDRARPSPVATRRVRRSPDGTSDRPGAQPRARAAERAGARTATARPRIGRQDHQTPEEVV